MNWYLDDDSPSGLSSKRLKRPVGCIGNHGYYQVTCRKKGTLLAHRVIWEMVHGKIPDGLQVDHIDRCRTNNRMSNLRLVTCQENTVNTAKHVDNKTGHKNISFHQGGYAVEVMRQGRRRRTTAKSLEEAIRIREEFTND
jgi:hypothetical protein